MPKRMLITSQQSPVNRMIRSKRNGVKETAKKLLGMLENDVFPIIGQKPIADLRAPDILEAIRKIEKRGALEAAHTLQTCGRIIRYAMLKGKRRWTSLPVYAE